ncbi:ester cyclase [Starkeya koreensis]|uniref:Ester cyclase n=1 Tax=Ancylobacter koreensis TaxID=266121 RepID=A0ABT0DN33_9HYPH|nr:ester cyclase [Ancylobacter koreensis]MCK0208683.1 ester cyclase [Ancylobacter koreensis]
MPLTPALMDAKINEHFAFEANDDVEGVLSTLTPDCEHDVVGWPAGPSFGHEPTRGFYETLFADLADGSATPIRRMYGENFLVDETLWSGRAVGRPFGIEGGGRPLEFRMLHVIEFASSGNISREQVWLDVAAILRQLS